MNWLVKVAAFKTLSAIPGGQRLYRFSQENITKSLYTTTDRVIQKLEVGLGYLDWLDKHGVRGQLIAGTHLDVGAGWHPTIPLLFHSLGVQRQWLVDVVPVMTREGVLQTVTQYRAVVGAKEWKGAAQIRRLAEASALESGPWPGAFENLGCTYIAPYREWLEQTQSQIDVATCTQVLMHVPPAGLAPLFQGIFRALKPGGKFLAEVHLKDLFSDSDRNIGPYNHLKFSPETWSRVNSPLMSYNRLKAPDYREALVQAGFEILHFEVNTPEPADFEQLDRIAVHPCFSRYSRAELAAKHLFFVAGRP